jgi:flagellar biosynthesis protein FliR
VHLALPVIVVTLGVQLALALVARAAPSLQIFNVGFGVLVAAGLCTLLGSADTLVLSMAEWSRQLPDMYESFFAAVRG